MKEKVQNEPGVTVTPQQLQEKLFICAKTFGAMLDLGK